MATSKRAGSSATENSGKTTNLRPFRKGQSGNPGGRPKGLAAYVRTLTLDGKELAEFMAAVLRRSGEFEGARIDLDTRMEAATWLADRGFGKPVQAMEVGGPAGAALAPVVEIVYHEPAPTTAAAGEAPPP